MVALLVACAELPAETADIDVTCPAERAPGLAVGDVVQDLAFTDCAGTPVTLHGLCGAPALITTWYGWCPTCNDNAALARAIAAEHPDLTVATALTEDPLSAPVDAELCVQYEQTYPSTVATWMDPAKALAAYGTTDLVLVLDADGTIAFSRETSTEATIRAAVEGVLAE